MRLFRNAFFVVFVCSLVWAEPGQGTKQTTFEVPYKLSQSVHMVVRAKVNGKGPFNLIVDTGAPVTFLAEEQAKKIGLEPDENLWSQLEKFELEGGLVIPKTKIRVETPFQLKGMNGMALAGLELHGLIGYDLLARHRIEFDLGWETMKWTPLDFEPKRPLGIGGKGKSSSGGLEVIGSVMKTLGAFMGMKPPAPPKPRGSLGLELTSEKEQIKVVKVFPQTAASKSGFQPGDFILSFNGKPVSSLSQLRKYSLATTDPTFQAIVERNGKMVTLDIAWQEGY